MKKLLFLFCMLLMGVSGAWADETFTVINNAAGGVWSTGTYSSDNGNSNWKGSWTSTSTAPQITVTSVNAVSTNAKNTYLLNNSTGVLGSSDNQNGTFVISISSGYRITGYEIEFENANTDGSHNQTITPDGGTAATAEGTGSATASKSGLSTRMTKFVLTGENSHAKITKFTITYVSVANVGSGTWASGVPSSEVGGTGKYYSTTWYLRLTTPNYNDVFFNSFELSFASDGAADDDIPVYLAFTYDKFTGQYNHAAGEFIAISSNNISGHSSSAANTETFTFSDKVRMNGNVSVYVCFVSKNADGTYNLQKKGIAVKSTSTDGNMYFCSANTYTTTESNASDYQCHYTCAYTTAYDFAQTSENYHIFSGLNNGDKSSGGKITIAYMKYTAPGTSGQYVHFDQFSMSMRDGDVVANTYLLFGKELLTGTINSAEFAPSKFTAISTNNVPSANYGKVFTFTFDTDAYLDGGASYYVYMGTKQTNGNFKLQKYGLFINDGMYIKTGLTTRADLSAFTSNDVHNSWQAIYYTSKCTFADQKVTLNIKEAGTTIRTKTIYTNADVDVKTALNIPSIYTVTPATITHAAGSSERDINISAAFQPSSTPAIETKKVYFIKLHNLYAGGTNGNDLNSSTDYGVQDRWTVGGNYYDGYTFYNKGKEKYLCIASNSDNTVGTFVTEGSASKFIASVNSTGYGFKLAGTKQCYWNNRNNKLSTWKHSDGATADGSRVTIVDPANLLSDVYTPVYSKSGSTLGRYSHPSISLEDINTALENGMTAYNASDGTGMITSFLELKNIKDGLVLNMPADNTFLRIKSNSQSGYYLSNDNNQYGNINKINTLNAKGTIFLYKDNNLINYSNGQVVSERYGESEAAYFPTIGEVGATPTTISFSAATAEYLYNIGFKDNTRSFKINQYASDAGASGQTGGDYDFTLEEVTSLPVTVTAANYATFCSPVAVDIPEVVGVMIKAYYASDLSDGSLKMTSIDGTIPANTPVIIYANPSGTYNFPIHSGSVDAIADKYALFCGTTAAVTAASVLTGDYASGYAVLTLQKGAGDTAGDRELGFYKYSGANLGGFKTYMLFDTSGLEVKGFRLSFDDDNATGLEAMDLEAMDNGQWIIDNGSVYNLAGQKVNGKLPKGLYIVNGKKVLVK